MEKPNFNTETVSSNHDDLLTGVKTKVFLLHKDDKELWKHLDNVVYTELPHQSGKHPQVRVIIPSGHKAYSHGRVIRDGQLVFTYE